MFETYKKLKIFLSLRQRWFFCILVFLMAISALLEIVGIGSIPLFVSVVLDYELLKEYLTKLNFQSLEFVTSMKQEDLLFFMSISIMFLFIFKNLFLMLVHYLQSYFAYNVITNNSTKIYKKYLFSNYSFHTKRNSVGLIKNLVSEINISSTFISSILYLFRELIIFSLICYLLLLNSPSSFFYVSILFLLFLILFYFLLKKKVTESGKKFYKSRDKLIFTIQQSLGFIKEILLLNKRNIFFEHFQESLNTTEFQNVFMSIINKIPRLAFEILAVLICLLIVNYFFLNSRNDMLPILTLYGVSLIRLIPSYTQISQSIMNIKYYKISFDVICKELQIKDSISIFGENIEIKKDFKYQENKIIQIKDLCFAYSNNKNVLNSINLKFKTGQAIGIVGSSGSGKTTLGDLIMGLYEPTSGEISYDGININNHRKEWRNMLGYVPQEIFLLDNNIESNIAAEFDSKKIDKIKLKNSINTSNCHEFINQLPEGVNTNVGERGVKLSGGQRQRIGIARALYNDPDIILFDEATSSLDVKNEQEIIKSITKLKKNKTLICISHKLSNLKNMDIIIVLKDGVIVKMGKSEEIINYLENNQ